MTQHQFIETRRSSDNRKVRRCTVCEQEWTGEPGRRIYCPGVPVVRWSQDRGTLRTATQAKKEYYVLSADAKPVAVLRLDSDPWYVWLYDMSGVEQRLPSEEQRQQTARREQTIREKYGCRMCSKRYLKRDAAGHTNGVCYNCYNKAREWNRLLAWSRDRVADQLQILDLVTEPEARPMDIAGKKFQLSGYRSYDFSGGNLIGEGNLVSKEDYASFFYLLHMAEQDSPKERPYGAILTSADKPLFLFCGYGDLIIFWSRLRQLFGRQVDTWNSGILTTSLPCHRLPNPLYIPKPGGVDWLDCPNRHLPQNIYYHQLGELFGLSVEPGASVVAMLQQVVGYLAAQPPIEGV